MIAQDQLVGARFEKCVVERLIGRGGYGLTFLAFDEELQEHRVIKVSQDQGLDEIMRRRHLKSFLEEGLILSRLKHPQIVTLRGQGDKHGHRYMILDYIQGFSLRNVLDIVTQRQQELGCAWRDLMDPVTATALVLSALYPLEYAHRANVHLPDREIFGVAHRDISPGNLILGVKGNEKGRLILIDFGTAKTELSENITVDQNLVGTVPYMGKARLQKANSPEQMALYQDFWKDFRETQHDIHALGVLYYQLLTGRLPFAGETSPQIIVKILDPECYSQCHLEIASAHPYASGVLRKCLVYHDFSQALSEQPYQYPDAAGMLPDMVEVFDTLSSGNSVNEILVNFGKKLARPEHWVPAQGREAADSPPSTDMQGALTLPSPTRYFALQAPTNRARRAGLYAALAGSLALLIAAVLWFRSHSPGLPGVLAGRGTGAGMAALGAGSAPTVLEKLDDPANPAPANAHAQNPAKASKPQKPAAAANEHAASHTPSAPSTSAHTPKDKPILPTSLVTQEAQEAAGAVLAPPLDKEVFVQLQTLVREEDPTAFEKISSRLMKNPESPDLRLLKCQLTLIRNPASAEARRELVALSGARPEFSHVGLFHESVLYLLFQADAAIYEAQKTPLNRVNMQKSGNAYLSEYQPNPAYEVKVKSIQDRLSK